VQIPFSKYFVRQFISDRSIHTQEIMQRVAIFHLGQTPDHKRTGILRAEKLLALLIRWLFLRFFRRHFVRFHDSQRLFPPFAGGTFAGFLKGWRKVDSALLPVLPVTARAIGVHEWSDHLF